MNANGSNLETIFFRALNIQDAAARSEYLAQACGQDGALLLQVEQMLSVQSKVGSFLEQPPAAYAGTVNLEKKILEAGLSASFGQGEAIVVGSANHSVLKSLGMTLSEVPRVLLREPKESGKDPIVRPRSNEVPSDASDSRYQLAGEIARGGMGAIIKGRDIDLGRDLAIKVLLDAHKDKPEVVQRFIEEAQIGGQLQHPGIVPVYELGQFGDQRPFFSMKLVKGETLAGLLSARKSPAEDRAKFLGIFEQVCQTMAYAHSRGVIHRDLKPANIMVGAFGEVQVMDWGLAKVLSAGGIADEKKSIAKQAAVSVIQTRRSIGSESPGSSGSQTEMGSVMGTPAYMSPEQALGEVDRLDERTDVFGLGAILCEILTGKPPYVAGNGEQVFRLASRGKLEDCYARLDACQVDAELKKIVLDGLALEPDDRLRDAGQFASRVSAYLESVETRLRKAEVERATESARAEEALKTAAQELVSRKEAQGRIIEERKRRRVTMALAASLMIGLVGTIWQTYRASQSERVALQSEKKAIAERDAKEDALKKEAEQRTLAEVAQQKAQLERDAAKLAREESRKSLYAASMSLIPAAWEADNVSRVHELLNEQIPKPGEEDLRHFEWHYWYRESHGASRSWKLGTDTENYVISEDGTKIVGWSPTDELASQDGSATVGDSGMMIRVFDVATRGELHTFRILPQDLFEKEWIEKNSRLRIYRLSVNRDGSRVACQFALSTVKDPSTSTEVNSSGLSNFMRRLVSHAKTVVYDIANKKRIFSQEIYASRLEISPNGKRLLTCEINDVAESNGLNGTLPAPGRQIAKFKVWDLDHPGNDPVALTSEGQVEQDGPTIDPKFSLDGSRLVMVTRHDNGVFTPSSIRFWDTVTGEEQLKYRLDDFSSSEFVTNLIGAAFSPDGKTLVTLGNQVTRNFSAAGVAARDVRVHLWDCANTKEIKPLQTDGGISIGNKILPRDFGMSFSPDGELLLAWNKDERNGSIINIANRSVIQTIKNISNIRNMAFSHDGMSVLTVSGDFPANVFSPAVASALVQEWEVVSSNGNKPMDEPLPTPGSIVVLSPNKLRQATYESRWGAVRDQPESDTKTDILISDTSGKEVFVFREHSIPITSVSFSPDGRWVISSSVRSLYDSETYIWEADTGKVRWSNSRRPTEEQQRLSQSRFSSVSTDTRKAEFSPNGKWLSLPEDGRRRIVAWPELEDRIVFESEVKVFISPDSRRLVSLQPRIEAQSLINERRSQGTEMKIWDIESGRMLASHFNSNAESSGSANRNDFTQLDYVFFSQDSRFCSPRGTFGMPLSNSVTIYDLSMGNDLVRIQVKQELGEGSLTSRFGSNRSLVFSPNGDRLMISESGRQGRTVLPRSAGIWELPSGKLICRLDGNAFAIQMAAFSSDGKRIATASDRPDKGEVKIWDATTGREMLNLVSQRRIRVKSIFFSRDGKQLTLQKILAFTPAGPSETEIVWGDTPRDRSTAPAP